MQDILKQYCYQKKLLPEKDTQLLLQRLQDLRLAHENTLDDLKSKSWNVLIDQKNRFQELQSKYDELMEKCKQRGLPLDHGHSPVHVNIGGHSPQDPVAVLNHLRLQLANLLNSNDVSQYHSEIEDTLKRVKEQLGKISLRGNEPLLRKGQVSLSDLRESKRDVERLQTEVKMLKAEKQELLLTHENEIRKLRHSMEQKLQNTNSAFHNMKKVSDVRLIQEMDELRDEYESKLNEQRRQTIELRKFMDNSIDRVKEYEGKLFLLN
ncbi:viral A-type inclusion protein [Reticulomyxa filosa]|uniref:Viral A-type inclusion protein n=1 Tax=Reticulomyxa filosa TaxID=46433 RepID=X6M7A1_RETFI|nr:viral A-type inclusion protein [Reticulomyxa filosa]|eukprot:ETO08875.1 viral A-type inclusion protein [Reticulomyxa filosa]